MLKATVAIFVGKKYAAMGGKHAAMGGNPGIYPNQGLT